jgi:hypothetical protein
MFLRLILAAIQAYNGNSDTDAKLPVKQVAIGCALTAVVIAILGLILPDGVRQFFRLIRWIL